MSFLFLVPSSVPAVMTSLGRSPMEPILRECVCVVVVYE